VRISVFGASSCRQNEFEAQLAYRIGKELAKLGVVVVNGARTGVMQAVSRGAQTSGGEVWGVMRNRMSVCNPYVTTQIICDDSEDQQMSYEMGMSIRTARLLESDGFIVILGPSSGVGTHKELSALFECELHGWHPTRPCAVLTPYNWLYSEIAAAFGINLKKEVEYSLIREHEYQDWLRMYYHDCAEDESLKIRAAIKFVTGQTE